MSLGALVRKIKPVFAPWSAIKKVAGRFPPGSLHLFILFNLAIAQPLFDVLARSAPFFVAERSQPVDIIVLVLLLCILVPAFFLALEIVASLLSEKLQVGIHTLLVALLLATIALPALKRVGDAPGVALGFGAGLIGIAGVAAYLRFNPVRQLLTFASIGVLVIPATFLLNSNISKIVFPDVKSKGPEVQITSTTPVVMVIFDELPSTSLMDENRQIDPARYPNFANLAGDAHWFRNATTVADTTMAAVPAILTGQFPGAKRLPTSEDYPNNLFTLLGDSHEMRVFESLTSLCPTELCNITAPKSAMAERIVSLLVDVGVIYSHVVLPDEMTSTLPAIDQKWHNFLDLRRKTGTQTDASEVGGSIERGPRQFASFVKSIDRSSVPRLYFLHILLPHQPWKYLPSGKTYESSAFDSRVFGFNLRDGGETWVNDEWLVTQGLQRHLLQVGFADKLLGDLIARLKKIGLYESSLLIVTADHGISFGPGVARRRLSPENLQDVLPVPLLVKLPYQERGVVSDRIVQTVDIFPTIVDVLGVVLPWRFDGRSLFDTSILDLTELTVFNYESRMSAVAPVSAKMYETLDRNLAVFGSGDRVDGLYRIGRYSRIIGREPGAFSVEQASDVRIWLYGASLWQHVDPQSEFVPARIIGGVDPGAEGEMDLHLAAVINGTIQGVTRTYFDGQHVLFSVIVPERSFRKGYNHVELFVVSGPTDRPRLRAPHITRRGTTHYSISILNGRETIATPGGQMVPIVPGAVGGNVDRGIHRADVAAIGGWAADLRAWQPAESILVLVNGEVVRLVRPHLERPDVASHFGKPDLVNSGFLLHMPPETIGDPANTDVRVIALSSHGVASELTYGEEYAWRRRRDETQPAPVQLSDFESSPEYALSMDGGSINIVSSSGQIIPIVSDTVAGYVDLWSTDGQFVFISGWAADVRRSQQVKLVLLFVNGQSVSARETNFARPDVVRESGIESLLTSGFDFAVPSELLGALDNTEVRLFAITKDEEAQELAYVSGYPWPRRSEDSIQ